MAGDLLVKGVFAILKHLYHQIKLLVKFLKGVLLFLFKLLLDLSDVFTEHLGLSDACLNLLLKDVFLLDKWVNFKLVLVGLIANLVAFVLSHNAFRTDKDLIVLAEVLSFLLRMLQTKLFMMTFVLFFFVFLVHVLRLAYNVQARADPAEAVDLLLVINVVCKNYNWLTYGERHLPRIVKFFISCLTSGEKTFLHVGQVRMFEVLRSIRHI